MKLNFGRRLVLFVHWLLSLVACVFVVMHCLWPAVTANMVQALNNLVGTGVAEMIGIAVIAVYIVLAVATVAIVFSGDGKKKGERGFIVVDSNEGGRIRIATGAVEQMIRQAVRSVSGIGDMKANIINNDDAVSINTTVTVASGAHVPTVTMNIQRAIRSYIELNCGIAVQEVSVSVQALDNGEGAKGRKKNSVEVPAAIIPEMESVAQASVNETVVVEEAAAETTECAAVEEVAAEEHPAEVAAEQE